MKKLTFLVSIMFLCLGSMMAQTTVSGTISDDAGESLIGASVLAKGTAVGTITDIDGRYTITLPEGVNTLVVSYVGYTETEINVTGPGELNVTMASNSELIDEIVVTGLGIKRDKKALGYGVTTIDAADIQLKPEADVGRILNGKVPGVNIQSTSGLAGSGTNVVIRGYTSITGDNQALFVVDGVPFNSQTNNDRGFSNGSTAASSRFLDLDPNNIAEISVLKGLSATVLYGEAGRNGVILVTTKNGANNEASEDLKINVNQSVFATQVASLPEIQNSYGNGWQNFAAGAFSNWGAPFDQPNKNGLTDGTIAHPYSRGALNEVLPQYVDARYDYKPYPNLVDFFKTGIFSNTYVSASKRIGTTNISVNYGHTSDTGFTLARDNGEESNELKRNNFGLGITSQLTDKLTLSSTFNYVTSKKNAPPAAPIYSSNPTVGSDAASLFSNVLYTPRSVDLFGLEYANPLDNSTIFYRGGNDIQHPLWTLNNINDAENLSRFFGNVQATYNFTDNLFATYRIGLDNYSTIQDYTVNKGGTQIPDGLYYTSNRNIGIIDQNLSVGFNKNLTEDFSFDVLLGGNVRSDNLARTYAISTQQFIFGLFNHSNFVTNVTESEQQRENLLGLYGTATAGFKNFLYATISARNDWTSTLEEENRSVFYPSASLAMIVSEAIPGLQNNNVVNYLKVRLGYGTSAGYPDPYQTRNVLSTNPRLFIDGGGSLVSANTVDNQFGNPLLTAERHNELELGVEGKFVNNRVGLDLSLYNKESKDLIIPLDLDPSTGGTETTINAASMNNKGIEVALSLTPVRTSKFTWDIRGIFTKNVSEVVGIADGVDQILVSGLSFLGNFAIPGEPYGIIQGGKIIRDDAGNPIISAAGTYQGDTETGIIGDPNPDFFFNTISNLSYKSFTIGAQFDWRQGGDIWGSTASTLTGRGIAGETDFDRFVPVIASGVDAEGNPNTVQITPNRHYWEHTGVFYDENRIFDGTTVRLREISLSYSLPANMLAKTQIAGASITFAGQNLWYKALSFPDSVNFDPEVLSLGVGNGQGFDFVTGPTSKRYGATLSLTF